MFATDGQHSPVSLAWLANFRRMSFAEGSPRGAAHAAAEKIRLMKQKTPFPTHPFETPQMTDGKDGLETRLFVLIAFQELSAGLNPLA
jgi:hypothetical protein